jgi:hypothetical protein
MGDISCEGDDISYTSDNVEIKKSKIKRKRKSVSDDVANDLLLFLKESSSRTMSLLELESKREEKRLEYEKESDIRKDRLLEMLIQKF